MNEGTERRQCHVIQEMATRKADMTSTSHIYNLGFQQPASGGTHSLPQAPMQGPTSNCNQFFFALLSVLVELAVLLSGLEPLAVTVRNEIAGEKAVFT